MNRQCSYTTAMVLDQLLSISQHGANLPLEYWLDFMHTEGARITPKLTATSESLPNGKLRRLLTELMGLLGQAKPNEQILAEHLVAVADLFTTTNSAKDVVIINYTKACRAFIQRVRLMQRYAHKRAMLIERLSLVEQQHHDIKLFELEGMMYTLEYYLALYKNIVALPTATERYQYIVQPEVNLDFGNVPGLQSDFENYEVLEKFILLILNDPARARLTKAYFFARIQLIQLTNDAERLAVALAEFKQLIIVLLEEFKQLNIMRLTGSFNTPYGKQPLLDDVLQQL